jgi:hypothetical protein
MLNALGHIKGIMVGRNRRPYERQNRNTQADADTNKHANENKRQKDSKKKIKQL